VKAMKRRLGILTVAVVLICLSVSLGTWVAKRHGEMQTVGWSPLFESREQRALTPLRTIEAMGQGKPTEGCTRDCTPGTSDCADTKGDCREETLAGPDCDTVDLTCGCDSWFAPCDVSTFDIVGCSTYEATCYEADPNCAEPTSDAATCNSGYPTCDTCAGLVTCDDTCGGGPDCEGSTFAAAGTCDSTTPTCSGETCDSTCEGRETCDLTCYDWDPNCAETVDDTCDCPDTVADPDCGDTTDDTCSGETCDATCDTCKGETCDAFPCEDTWDDTCDCGTVVTTCEGVETCGDTCVTGAPGCTYDSTCSGGTCDDTCVTGAPGCTYDSTCSGGTCDDTCVTGAPGCTYDSTCSGGTCDDTCVTGAPGCTYDSTCGGGTCDDTCVAGAPGCTYDTTCSGETCDATCDRALPTCDATCEGDTCDGTCDCGETWDDTCDFTCDRDLPFCGDTFLFCSTFMGDTCLVCFDTMGFTCDADDPACPGDTVDATCAWDDPDCAEVTLDCPETWDCEGTLDCRERPEVEMDFGDAPNPSRHTRLADDGARHIVDEDYHLGLRIDEEPDGQPNPAAIGDDIPDRRDDEDGVWFTTSLLPGRKVSLIVEASAEGYLDAWVDSDDDGDWGGAGEQIFVGQPLSEGFNVLSFDAPRIAVEGPAFSRFRFSSRGYLSYTGLASDGEVEDHYLPITEAFGAAIKTDRMEYMLGEDATVTFYVNEAAEVRLVDDRPDERVQVLWSGTVNPGTHRLRQVPITGRVGRGTVALLATSSAGSTTAVSTPFDVAHP
jgi:hypothetical protein